MRRIPFPLAALVGQEEVRLALLVALANPKTGGLVIGGESGTAKSTLARGLAEIVGDDQVIELPLSATEDMVLGGLDLNCAIASGERRCVPGILARAHHKILYIDEINLLRRELLSQVLEAGTAGQLRLEREGLSSCQLTKFTLLGTMNPGEGELPPAILDRFGMYVSVCKERNAGQRAEIIRRILRYEQNPAEFVREFSQAGRDIRKQVTAARALVTKITVNAAMMLLAAEMCAGVRAAGHRAELYLLEAAKGVAALAGRNFILPADMEQAAMFVLPQRLRKHETALPDRQSGKELPEEGELSTDNTQLPAEKEMPPAHMEENTAASEEKQIPPAAENSEADAREPQENSLSSPPDGDGVQADLEEQVTGIDASFPQLQLQLSMLQDRMKRDGSGKRSLTRTDARQGRYVRSGFPRHKVQDLAFDATLRAAAPYQKVRRPTGCAVVIQEEDLRQKIREKRIGSTFVFVVDASGSMGARERMKQVKGAVCAMLQDAYQKRDQVGLIAFRRSSAEVLLPVTRSVERAQKCLQTLPTGGKTPLAEGLAKAYELLRACLHKDQTMKPVLVLVTDGRVNDAAGGDDGLEKALQMAGQIHSAGISSAVIDTEHGYVKLGLARRIARELDAAYYPLQELSQQQLLHIVQQIS